MRNLSPSAVASFWSELEKIAGEPTLTDRALLAAPGVGGAIGGAVGYLKAAPHLKAKGKALAALSGVVEGATLGWLPSVARDLKDAIFKKEAANTQVSAVKLMKPMTPASNAIKVPSAVSAQASTGTNLTELRSAF